MAEIPILPPSEEQYVTRDGVLGLISSSLTNFTEISRVQRGLLQSGNFVSGSTGWRLLATGDFEGNNGTFRGTITATTGTIGGFTIAATTVSATNLTLTSGAANTANIAVGTGSNTAGLNSANGSTDIAIWAGDTFANRATAPFRVTAGGAVTASNITATAQPGSNVFQPTTLDTLWSSGLSGAITVNQVSQNVAESATADIGVCYDQASSQTLIRFQQFPTTVTSAIMSYWRQNAARPGGTALADLFGGFIKIGSFWYYSYYDDSAVVNAMNRVDADLTNLTAITFSGTTGYGSLGWDQANSYLLILSGTTTVRRYTISGTTITYVDAITLSNAVNQNAKGFLFDGTNYYGYDSANSLLRKFNSSGTQLTTVNIGNISAVCGILKLGGILHLAVRANTDFSVGGFLNLTSVNLVSINNF